MIASVLLLLSGIAQESRPDPSRFLTDHFHKLWKKHRIEPASKCEDLAFLRRVSLDLIGRIPDRVERDTFLKLPQAKRRKLWIDRLLERSEHAQFLSRLWSSRLMPTPSESFRGWCESQLKRNVSYRELVINLITASGASRSNGAVHFILQHLGSPLPKSKRGKEGQHDLIPLTGRVMRSFLSLTVDCAQCHSHPFEDTFKMRDFWGTNAAFRQVELAQRPTRDVTKTETIIRDNPKLNPKGMIELPDRGEFVLFVKSSLLNKTPVRETKSKTRRQIFAEALTKHPNFARTIVNQMWTHFLSRGLADYERDVSLAKDNVTHHWRLLDVLSKAFIESGYDLRALCRWICNSEVYALQSHTNQTNASSKKLIFFSRMSVKRLTREQLIDSILTGLEVSLPRRRQLRSQWMKQLKPVHHFSKTCEIETSERRMNPFHRALWLMNSSSMQQALGSRKGLLTRALKSRTLFACVNELFQSLLARPLQRNEYTRLLRVSRIQKLDRAVLEDVLWALLNSEEFGTNH